MQIIPLLRTFLDNNRDVKVVVFEMGTREYEIFEEELDSIRYYPRTHEQLSFCGVPIVRTGDPGICAKIQQWIIISDSANGRQAVSETANLGPTPRSEADQFIIDHYSKLECRTNYGETRGRRDIRTYNHWDYADSIGE